MSTLKVSLMALSSRLLATALTVATTLILARHLGPEGIGEYFLFLRVVAVLAVLADLGFSQSTTVFAGRGESPGQIHGLMIRVAIGSSIVVSLLFITVLKLFGPTILPNYPRYLQLATMIALPFFVYASLWRYLMVGLAQIGKMNLVQIGFAATTFLMVIICIVGLSIGLQTAVSIYIGALIGQALVMTGIAASVGRSSSAPRNGLYPEMFRFGLRGAGGAIATLIWQRIPVFGLNVYHGQAAVGVFSVAEQLIEKMLLPMEAMRDAIYRRIARLPLAEAKAVMNRYVRISGLTMAGLLAAAGAMLPIAIVLVLGPQYRSAVPVVIALIPGAMVMSTAYLLSAFFVAHLGRPGLLSILATITLGTMVVLSAALIPTYGPIGAALAITGSQIVGSAVVVVIYLRTTGSGALDLMKIDRADRDLFRSQVRQLVFFGRPEELN